MKRLLTCILLISTSLMMLRCGDGAVVDFEDVDSLEEGLAVGTIATTALEIINFVSTVVGLATGIPSLVQLMDNTSSAGASVAEISSLLKQQALGNANWVVASGAGQLKDKLRIYYRRSCTVDNIKKDPNCANAANQQFIEANNIYSIASQVFNDVVDLDKFVGNRKLQLIPVMMEAASAKIFALQEILIAEVETLGVTADDNNERQRRIRDEAAVALRELDRAEALLYQASLSKCGPIQFHYNSGGISGNLPKVEANFTNEQGNMVTYWRWTNAADYEFNKRLVLAQASDEKTRLGMDYFRRDRSGVFGNMDKYNKYRSKLIQLSNYAKTRYIIYFRWSPAGWPAQEGNLAWTCIQITEPSDPYTWEDNFFCASRPLGMRWSFGSAISGMKCTNTREAADPHSWGDNYICLPQGAPFTFSWSGAGKISGKQCTQWYEASDPNTWNDNYLCYPPCVAY